MNMQSKSSYHSPFVKNGRASSGKAKSIVSPMTAEFRIISQQDNIASETGFSHIIKIQGLKVNECIMNLQQQILDTNECC